MENLKEIGIRHKTDKSRHTHAGKTYLDIYEIYFSKIRENKLNFLEIGVKNGSSHRLWKEYFKNSTIYGLDIDPRCKIYTEDRINIFIGSQSDENIIKSILDEVDGGLDIILDDGSHINELTIKSFEILFNKLNTGGFYIIEDLGCSYNINIGEQIEKAKWPGMEYNNDVKFSNNREDLNILFNKLIEDLDKNSKVIEYVHFYSRICIIKKI
jgi:hypothetical protein